ncbi:hypothetical protein TBLA_0A02690 [Henningerozyma blattae CBS 6284]|uniref:Rho-GAP domain-containing protein n=1 Tax=Henningerozyma blattae (strain ATCC 34711 / CBS 6284 / DSM 70876 / NBRC 10599 / NRRL Y-10934 / UCD 77-7) TaxID=1071380 RepID=I2GVB6_HENB6|nr:hypothetical protein TBLA_0A02690 [Tetrapisispora blattae CBS 6284]CCH58068.1 hypothetical protein TBLA_0A02690 [Tetrapisispora blattae CBS 6284]
MSATVAAADFNSSNLTRSKTLHPCARCKLTIDSGHAYELGEDRWHTDCFSCYRCEKPLNCDTDFMVLGTGALICFDCSDSCKGCGKKIDDLAIILSSSNEAYCSSCFKCCKCHESITDLKYAKTKRGLFCLTCHEKLVAKRKRYEEKKRLYKKDLPTLPDIANQTSTASSITVHSSISGEYPQLSTPIHKKRSSTLSHHQLHSDGAVYSSKIVSQEILVPPTRKGKTLLDKTPLKNTTASRDSSLGSHSNNETGTQPELMDNISNENNTSDDPMEDLDFQSARTSSNMDVLSTISERNPVKSKKSTSDKRKSTNILLSNSDVHALAAATAATNTSTISTKIPRSKSVTPTTLNHIDTSLNPSTIPISSPTSVSSPTSKLKKHKTSIRPSRSHSIDLKISKHQNISRENLSSNDTNKNIKSVDNNPYFTNKSSSSSNPKHHSSAAVLTKSSSFISHKISHSAASKDSKIKSDSNDMVSSNSRLKQSTSVRHSLDRKVSSGASSHKLEEKEKDLQNEIGKLEKRKQKLIEDIEGLESRRDKLTKEVNYLENDKFEAPPPLVEAIAMRESRSTNTMENLTDDKDETSYDDANDMNLDSGSVDQLKEVPKGRFWKLFSGSRSNSVSPQPALIVNNTSLIAPKKTRLDVSEPILRAPDVISEHKLKTISRRSMSEHNFKQLQQPLMPVRPIKISDPSVLYGSTLVARCEFEKRSTPLIITKCIQYIESDKEFLQTEGIYRKSASQSLVEKLETRFSVSKNYDADPKMRKLMEQDIHAVASALKRYLRQLPNSIIPFEIYDELISLIRRENLPKFLPLNDNLKQNPMYLKTINKFKELLKFIPREHYAVLQLLSLHLKKVVSYSEENLMNIKNISLVFTPGLIRDQNGTKDILDMRERNYAVEFILTSSADLLGTIKRLVDN